MKQVLSIAYYETLQVFKDKILALLILVVPLGYAAVFGAVYSAGLLTGIPLAVVDLDQSRLSREVALAFKNSPRFTAVEGIDSYQDLTRAMRTGVVRAGVVIPEHFEEDLATRRTATVFTAYDASNLLWGYNARKYTAEVINTFAASHAASFMAGLGMNEQEIRNVLEAVTVNMEVWYNPTYSYVTFLFLGLVVMIVHQICLLSVSLTVTREKDSHSWVQFLAAPAPRWKIMAGKCLPYFIANFFNYSLLIWFAAAFVGVKVEGSLPLVVVFGLLFDVIITAAGFYVSALASNSLQATRLLMLLSVPVFIVSGYTWPATHIPPAVNWLARLLPYTWMAEGLRLVTVKNAGVERVLPHLAALAAAAAAAVLLATNYPQKRKPPV